LPDGISVVAVKRHTHKLRTGLLAGNRFRIRLQASEPDALDRARAICAVIAERGLPNYFGGQRFGRGGQNLARAMAWASGGAGAGRRSRFFDKLLPSVLQAEVFNRFLTRRLEAGLDRLLPGDVVRLGASNSVFVVEDPEAERPRLERREIALTGPILGPKTLRAKGQVLELEIEAAHTVGLDDAVLDGWRKVAPGTRRDLVVFPDGLGVEAVDGALHLGFSLPAGSYATQLLRELTRGPHLDTER
jgi:tRNA pseudouridine13 synthase